MQHKLAFVGLLLLLLGTAYAGAHSNKNVYQGPYTGVGPGVSTIGTGGDYASLFDATNEIRKHTLTGGDWDFVVLNDLIEPNNSIISQQGLSSHTITFRPAPGTKPTVTFTTTTRNIARFTVNASPGHIIVGAKVISTASGQDLEATAVSNIVFNGSSTPNGQDRSLFFTDATTPSLGQTTILQVYGQSDNIAIENCRFLSHSSGRGLAHLTGTIDFLDSPRNITILNCDITAVWTPAAGGIGIHHWDRAAQPQRGNYPVKGLRIENNNIRANRFGIAAFNGVDAVIRNNTILMEYGPIYNDSVKFGITCGRRHFLFPDQVHYEVSGNTVRFLENSATTPPLVAISAEDDFRPSSFTIFNNMVSGISSPPPFNWGNRYGIEFELYGASTANVAHNSVHIHSLASSSATTASRIAAMAITGTSGTLNLRNNIFSVQQPEAAAFAFTSFGSPNYVVNSNSNSVWVPTDGVVAFIHGSYCESLADWQSSTGQDLQSIFRNPFEPGMTHVGTWTGLEGASNTDMHFSSFPGEEYLAPAHPDVIEDIDGTTRPGPNVLMGAHEVAPPPAAISHWNLY